MSPCTSWAPRLHSQQCQHRPPRLNTAYYNHILLAQISASFIVRHLPMDSPAPANWTPYMPGMEGTLRRT